MRNFLTRSSNFFLLFCCIAFVAACGGNDNFTLVGSGGEDASNSKVSTKNDGIEPINMNLKVFGFYASTNADCSDPITVFTDDNPTYTNLLGNPTLGTGTLPDGTYNCVIIEMSDNIEFAPTETSDSGNCVADETSVIDVCREGNGDSKTNLDGDVEACEGGDEVASFVEDRVFLYISTDSALDGTEEDEDELEGSGFAPPVDADTTGNGINLSSPLVVSGDAEATFVVDGTVASTGGISDNDEKCDIPPPLFSFE